MPKRKRERKKNSPSQPTVPSILTYTPYKKFSQLLPLLLTVLVLAAFAWVAYHVYLSVSKMQGHVSQRMGKKNVVFTKDGLKVGVKHVENEREVDATQSYFVKAWNLRANEKLGGKKGVSSRKSK